jgi:biopolymer transport protein ExbD
MTPEELENYYNKKNAEAKARRRHRVDEEAKLGLTSLMDIVSIIVVYLLKSYASDPVVITPLAEQKIPMSPVDAPMQSGEPIYVSTRDLVFGDKKIAKLSDGVIDPGVVNNHLIEALHQPMLEQAEKGKALADVQGKEWPALAIIIGDADLKFTSLVDVMFTAGRAGYTKYAFCVVRTV